MEHYQYKDLLDIKTIIQFGKRSPENYQVQIYEAIYGKKVTVRIRGLSNYEFDEIALRMYEVVKDTKTINFIFNPKNENKNKSKVKNKVISKNIPEIKENIKENTDLIKSDVDEEIPEFVNLSQLTLAYTIRNVYIVYYAMKDYYRDLTLDMVKQIEGIDDIAKRVNEKSGRTPEIMEKIEFFREKQRELTNQISNE